MLMDERYAETLLDDDEFNEYMRVRRILNSMKVALKKNGDAFILICSARDDRMGLYTYSVTAGDVNESIKADNPVEYFMNHCDEILLVPGDESYWEYFETFVSKDPGDDVVYFKNLNENTKNDL